MRLEFLVPPKRTIANPLAVKKQTFSGSEQQALRNAPPLTVDSPARLPRTAAAWGITGPQLNRLGNAVRFAEQAGKCLIQPHHSPVNFLGGYRFADAPAIDVSPMRAPAAKAGVPTRVSPRFLCDRSGCIPLCGRDDGSLREQFTRE
jgi:hypothetical protein